MRGSLPRTYFGTYVLHQWTSACATLTDTSYTSSTSAPTPQGKVERRTPRRMSCFLILYTPNNSLSSGNTHTTTVVSYTDSIGDTNHSGFLDNKKTASRGHTRYLPSTPPATCLPSITALLSPIIGLVQRSHALLVCRFASAVHGSDQTSRVG